MTSTSHVPAARHGWRPADEVVRVRTAVQRAWHLVRQHRRLAAGFTLLALLLIVSAVALLSTGGDPATKPDTPPNLPPQIQEDLADLHRAVNG